KSIETELDKDYHRKRELIDERIEVKTNLDRVGVLLDHKVEELARLEARYGVMEEATKRRTSSKAVEAVLKLRDQGALKGVHGTIGELGKVSPTYTKALEIAAGKGLSFLVVEDEGVAEKCITHLKQGHIGRATFLPLKKLKSAPPSREASRIAKSARGFALDLIRFDEKFRKAFATVSRNTVVVNDLAFAKRAIGRARMVTLDGDLIEPSGIMSGGHYRSAQEGFKELDKSRQRLHALGAEVVGLKEERTRLTNEDARIQEKLQELNAQELENTGELEALAERLRTLEGNITTLRKSIAEREVLLKEANSELKELKRDVASMQKSTSALFTVIRKIQVEKEGLENELSMTQAEELMVEMKALEADVSGLKEGGDDLRNQIRINESRVEEILTPRIKELHGHLSALAEESSCLEIDLESRMEKKSEVEAQLSTMEERKRKVSTGIESLKAKREGQVKAVDKIMDKIRGIRQRIEDMARSRERSRIEKAKLETKLEEVQKDLEAFADITVDLTEPIDTADLEKETAKMEAELESLEPINMRAIEDYEEVKEKFDKHNSRVEVLLAEKEAILKLMDEIEHRKKVVFMEVFECVVANFRGIFERLSPGGSADLLLDEDDPLDGGLQIQARPEGKNPRYIELMSGGEKTLTALSFIFAIQRFQPAPFYILDEIDMFLDDDNVRKVSELIQESSAGDQFIVVSLRSSLMASAGQLFGISNEDGVSKIIGVELEEIAA
ncbi:MAG: hypothetical protein QF829_01740, partial [Candidatus Hydrothermarchaeota archaeon]|nr:hypothetical protein [Candidatus Hydrothermarchaeota archaeon]